VPVDPVDPGAATEACAADPVANNTPPDDGDLTTAPPADVVPPTATPAPIVPDDEPPTATPTAASEDLVAATQPPIVPRGQTPAGGVATATPASVIVDVPTTDPSPVETTDPGDLSPDGGVPTPADDEPTPYATATAAPIIVATKDATTEIVPIATEAPVGGAFDDSPIPDDAPTEAPIEPPTATATPEDASSIAAQVIAAVPAAAIAGGRVALSSEGSVAYQGGGGLTAYDVTTDGVASLGAGSAPIWSPLGGFLLYTAPHPDTGAETATTWDRRTGAVVAAVGADGMYRDVPLGWDGPTFFFLRIFTDGSAVSELRQGSVDGVAAEAVLWTGSGGFGGGLELSAVGPGAQLAYVAGGALYLASLTAPDDPIASFPLPSGAVAIGWSPAGDAVAINDGDTVTTYTAAVAGAVRALPDGGPIAGLAWSEIGLLVVAVGPEPVVVALPDPGDRTG